MNKKTNGSGANGSGKGEDGEIVHFPTLAERDKHRREKIKEERKQERRWRRQYKRTRHTDAPPFFNVGNIPPFTRGLTVILLFIHIALFVFISAAARLEVFYFLGFVPGYFTGAVGAFPLHALLGPLTHVFIHSGWIHLLFNCVMLLALGTFFERGFGTRQTVTLFFFCALAGAALYFALNPFSTVPVIGASGGISGLFGAAIILLHRQGRMGRMGRRGPWPLIAFWVGFMLLTGVLSDSSLAWQAHIGGFLAGIIFIHILLKRKSSRPPHIY